MDLFITYQIPSDLISFGGDVNAQKSEKLNKVKTHVQGMRPSKFERNIKISFSMFINN
jgi:hypothetical protein